jgi:hypothetical protein
MSLADCPVSVSSVMHTRGANVRFRKNRTFPIGKDYDWNAARSDISAKIKCLRRSLQKTVNLSLAVSVGENWLVNNKAASEPS